MLEYARQRGLRRTLIYVPILTPRLSSLWLGLTTPVYARVGRKLIESIRHPTVVTDEAARRTLRGAADGHARGDRAGHPLRGTRVRNHALGRCGVLGGSTHRSWGGVQFGSRLVRCAVQSRPGHSRRGVYADPRGWAAPTGWYYADACGGSAACSTCWSAASACAAAAAARSDLRIGDALDFWRVEAYEPDRRLRLMAEMKLPGRAWLEFEVKEVAGGSEITQTAIFDPVGLLGLAYWYGIFPLHERIFSGMLAGIADRAVLPHPPSPTSSCG